MPWVVWNSHTVGEQVQAWKWLYQKKKKKKKKKKKEGDHQVYTCFISDGCYCAKKYESNKAKRSQDYHQFL